jgi:hypothetical protein
MEHLGGGEPNSEDTDIVFLAEGLGGAGDRFGRLGADGAGAVEAERKYLDLGVFDVGSYLATPSLPKITDSPFLEN